MANSSTDDGYRHPWEKLASEYLDKLRDGNVPNIDEFAQQCPDDAREVRELLQLVAVMEKWKNRRELASGGQKIPETFRLDRLGEYRLLREIGRGGMGVVFEAEQESMHRRVAVKLLPWRIPQDSRLRTRFQHEAVLAAQLRHKHIVPVYQFGEHEGWCYYVMHLVPGIGLDRVVQMLTSPPHELTDLDVRLAHQQGQRHARESGRHAVPPRQWWRKWWPAKSSDPARQRVWTYRRESWNQIARWGLQVSDALRYAHASGILHRDIKPGNLILDEQKRIWVADFGLAQLDRQETGNEPADDIAGTLRYTSPEQLAGSPDVRSDIYSLGVTLYELCTLQPAFPEKDRAALVASVRDKTPPPPREVNRRCPSSLSEIIMKACAKRPEDRYQTAAELSSALVGILTERDSGRF